MPRYCAVKLCRNRGGNSSKQDKRISFYPFPLQDNARLQKWVNNMRRREWTPSRHQYLCSKHFTEDCFDFRWGIRYLKNTAVPTLFPSVENGHENNVTLQRNQNVTPRSQAEDFDGVSSTAPLILMETSSPKQPQKYDNIVRQQPATSLQVPPIPESGIPCQSILPETHSTACKVTGDSGISATPCFTPSVCPEEQRNSIVTLLCGETLGPHSGDEEHLDHTSFGADQSRVFVEETGPADREHILVHEHSYCRPDTGKDELWSKILSLHAKIMELDRREESTVAKIHALENEIDLLKRDGGVFKEKQRVFEDYIYYQICSDL